ncbi:MAG: primosomal protein N' [marine benthic group bacterium]|nr:primosomal protein N' [Candidatus Benthicola marisminoris]
MTDTGRMGPFCRIALPRPVFQSFAYRVPPALADAARPGVRVRVPFGKRHEIGVIEELTSEAPGRKVKKILEVLDREPVLSPALLRLCRWTSEYYAAPPGLVFRAALPPGLLGDSRPAGTEELKRQVIEIAGEPLTLLERDRTFGRAKRQREAFETLESVGGSATVSHMEGHYGYSRSVLAGLVDRGVARISMTTVTRDPFAGSGEDVVLPARLNERQEQVLAALTAQSLEPEPGVALLRGVTGSGKTVVYLRLIARALERGRSAIVLVPEIALTPQTVQRFRAAFGDDIAVLHSALSAGERHDAWRALRAGERRVVIGTRSAIFAPVPDPGVIILDEEHDGSYKQSDTPRYHARALAAVRGREEEALVVLGSATPSLESWHNAARGRYALLQLPDRATPNPLPAVEIVDLREVRNRALEAGEAPESIVSPPLREAVQARLERREQSILLLNRRGYSTFLQCPACGKVWSCRSCNVSLTFHRARARLVCHHCAREEPVPGSCNECGEAELQFTGVGTEQVERRVAELFPAARILRMDVDTTGGKGAHGRLLEKVRRREVDILLGTQMIAKGLDFPGVTLVGVINADVGLNLPDFRAAERTFQLLAQVAGRAGRGGVPGEVLVQTARPHHPALQAALQHDYETFAEAELADREPPGYPPHRRLVNLIVSGTSEERVAEAAESTAATARQIVERHALSDIQVVGPAPCPIDRIRSRWRWHLLLKSPGARDLGALIRYLARHHGQPAGGMRLEIDRDPEALL